MIQKAGPDQPAPEWSPAKCTPLRGSASSLGVLRWHLDGVDFSPSTGHYRLRGWLVQPGQPPSVHVVVGRPGHLWSYLPNEARGDVAQKLDAQGIAVPGAPWCGFNVCVRAPDALDELDLGFERDGRIVWLRRCSAPDAASQLPSLETAVGEADLLAIARRHYGAGQARLVGTHEPTDSRKRRVHIHEVELDPGAAGRRVQLVEKRRVTQHELALARRLLVVPGRPTPEGFASVLEIAGPSCVPGWFVSEYVEPQPDMYLDPAPFIDELAASVANVNRRFADLAGESQRPVAMGIFRDAIERLSTVDQRLGTRGTRALADALPVLERLPVVASHNDFYWNNLGLERGDDGQVRVRMFDLELLGPNVAGAEFHQFARMVMEAEAFRAPFEALVRRHATDCGGEPGPLRIGALAYALVRSGMRLLPGTAVAKGADGSPRCEEPQAWAGMLGWLERELRESGE